MYRGKYTPSSGSGTSTQRKSAPSKNSPSRQNSSGKKRNRRKKPTTRGTVIFYTVFLFFILAFFIGMVILLNWLKGWLVDFEASQPEQKSQKIYEQYFADPDWMKLYSMGTLQGGTFEDAKSYADHMDQFLTNASVQLVETSAGMAGKKYKVRAIFEDKTYFDIADFTMVDKGSSKIDADWQLDKITLYVLSAKPPVVTTTYGYTFIIDPDNTVTVDGHVLNESHVIKTTTTAAEEYLPDGVHGYRVSTLYIGGLKADAKKITVTTPDGNPVEMSYDEKTRTYTQALGSSEMTDEIRESIVGATNAYCKFMIKKLSKDELKPWFDSESQIFSTIKPDQFLRSFADYTIEEPTLTNYYRYTEDLFSVRVKTNVKLTRKDGSIKNYPVETTIFMELQGKSWKVINMTNVDTQEQTTMIRMTYMVGNEILLTEMVDITSSRLTFPAVTVPEGQAFQGWATMTGEANGDTTYNLIFAPKPEGSSITLPEDYEMVPMTLYAQFKEVDG